MQFLSYDAITSHLMGSSPLQHTGIRWTEAEKMDMQVMETRKRVLGEEHPDTLTSMNNLAFTIQKQGRKGSY